MKDLAAVGRVSSVYPENMTAKVYLEDKEVVTSELPIVNRNDDWEPKIGDSVLCIFLPKGSSDGFIIGKF